MGKIILYFIPVKRNILYARRSVVESLRSPSGRPCVVSSANCKYGDYVSFPFPFPPTPTAWLADRIERWPIPPCSVCLCGRNSYSFSRLLFLLDLPGPPAQIEPESWRGQRKAAALWRCSGFCLTRDYHRLQGFLTGLSRETEGQ
jgi:hypothetical protein